MAIENTTSALVYRSPAASRPWVPSGISSAIGFFFAFRLFIMLLSVRWLGAEPQTGVAAGLVLTFLLLLVVAFHSLGPAHQSLKMMLQRWPVRWAFAYLCFSGCSLLWTGAASLPSAIVFWCAMASDVAIVLLLLRAGPSPEIATHVMRGYVYGACVIAIIAWVLPAQSDLRLGDEELLGPNQIGYLCAFAIFFAQYLARTKSGNLPVAVFVLFITLLRSLSKTSIVAFFIAEAFLLLRDRSIPRKTKVALVITAVIVAAAFWNLFSSYYGVYSNAGSQSETLTGRVGIWAYMLSEALQKPWLGHGFHSVWKVIPPYGPDQFEVRHAHNELLQQFYAYGTAGLVMFAGIYGSLFLHIRKHAAIAQKSFLFSFLTFILVRGLADTDPFDLSLPMWALVLIVTATDWDQPQNVIRL